MKLAYFLALYISGVLLVTVVPTSGLKDGVVGVPDDAKEDANEPRTRLLVANAAVEDKEEERVMSDQFPLERVADNLVNSNAVQQALTRASAASSSFEKKLRPIQTASFKNAHQPQPSVLPKKVDSPRSPSSPDKVHPFRMKDSDLDVRVSMLQRRLKAYVLANPNTEAAQTLEHIPSYQKPYMGQIDVAIALHLAQKYSNLKAPATNLEVAQFAKFFDEKKLPLMLRLDWMEESHRRAKTSDVSSIEDILKKYGKYYANNERARKLNKATRKKNKATRKKNKAA